MAKFTPDSTSFNINDVTRIETTDRVEASFVNGYYQKFLNNDAYLNAADAKMKHITTVTLATNSWQGATPPYTQAVVVSGVTANDYGVPTLKYPASVTTWTDKKAVDKEARYLTKCVTGSGTITFYAVEKPAMALTIELRGI